MAVVAKIMDSDVIVLGKQATIAEAAAMMAKKPHGCAIIAENRRPVGILTSSDIINSLLKKSGSRKAAGIMSSPVVTLSLDTKLEKADKIIETKHFRRYPVVDREGNIVGIVTENDVVQAINDNISFHRNLQNAVLVIFVLFEFFVFFIYKYASGMLGFLG